MSRAWRFANALARYDKDDEDKFRSSVAQALQVVGGSGASVAVAGGSGALEVDSGGAVVATGVNALNLSSEFVATVSQATPTVIVAVSLATTQPSAHTWSALQTFGGGAALSAGQTLALAGATVSGAPTWSSNQAITLSTAAQPNVTSLGILTALNISGAITSSSAGDPALYFTGGAANSTTFIYGQISGVGKFRIQRDGKVSALSLGVQSGTDINAGANVFSVVNTGAVTALQLTLSAAVSTIIPGATSLSLRNTANSADNILITNAGVVTLRNDLTVSTLGTLDSSGTRFGGAGSLTTYDLLSYDGAAAKWRPRLLQTSFNAAVVAASALTDGTFLAAANANPTLPADPGTNPGTPNTPTLIPIYQGMIIDVSNTTLPANEQYVIDYSVNGGAFTSNAIVGTGTRFVHSGLDSTKTYAYQLKIHYSVSNFTLYSAATAATNPSNVTETNAYGIIVASQIATIYLSAITANLGLITAGQIRNTSKTGVIQLDSTFALDAAAVNGIFFAGANPIPAQITGLGIDFTATGTNPLFKTSKLSLNADGSATFGGIINIADGSTIQGVANAYLTLNDPSVAHGMTALYPTTLIGVAGQATHGANDNLFITAIGAGTAGTALTLEGVIVTAGASNPVLTLRAWKKSGTNRTVLAATDAVFALLNGTNSPAIWLVTGDGSTTINGATTINANATVGGTLSANVGGSATVGRVLGVVGVLVNKTSVSVGEASLGTITLPASALNSTTSVLRIRSRWKWAGSGAAANLVRVKFGATYVASVSSVASSTAPEVAIDIDLAYLTNTTQVCNATEVLGNNLATGTALIERTAPAETLSNAITIDFRGIPSGSTLTLDSATVEVVQA